MSRSNFLETDRERRLPATADWQPGSQDQTILAFH